MGIGAWVDYVDVLGDGLFGQKVTSEVDILFMSRTLFRWIPSIPFPHVTHHIIITYLRDQVYIILRSLLILFPHYQLPQNRLYL